MNKMGNCSNKMNDMNNMYNNTMNNNTMNNEEIKKSEAWEIIFHNNNDNNEQQEILPIQPIKLYKSKRNKERLKHIMPLYYPDLADIIFSYIGWKDTVKLAQVNHALRNLLDEDITWRTIGLSMQDEVGGLFIPNEYIGGYKKVFFEQLWPARKMWSDIETVRGDFQIRVLVRMKPLDNNIIINNNNNNEQFILPLAQRMSLIRNGELSANKLFHLGDEKSAIQKLIANHGLPAEVLEAVMEANYLKNIQDTANLDEKSEQKVSRGNLEWSTWVPGTGLVPDTLNERDNNIQNVQDLNQQQHQQQHQQQQFISSNISNDYKEEKFNNSNDIEMDNINNNIEENISKKSNSVRLLAIEDSRVILYVPGQGVKNFLFSHVFNQNATQCDVYQKGAREEVISFLNGFNACFLCYGQTGSGKSFSITGPEGCLRNLNHQISTSTKNILSTTDIGVTVRACAEIISTIKKRQESNQVLSTLSAQYVEIYQNKITDLVDSTGDGNVILRNRGDRFGADQFILDGATTVELTNMTEVIELLIRAENSKTFASTKMNDRSSRSHCLFILTLSQTNVKTQVTTKSRLHFVDLAGSEQVKKSGAKGTRFNEAVGINYSLLVLGKVIRGLIKNRHVPYYESKLTQLLKACFGGNSRTTVVVCCSSDNNNMDQTLNSLRFGERCANVTNKNVLEAMSVEEALKIIDETLESCAGHMRAMEENNNQHKIAYDHLRTRHQKLLRRREELKRQLLLKN